MTRITAALFDIDGTLVDSNEFHVTAWQEAFAESGHRFEPQAIRDQIGKGADQLIPSLIPGASAEAGEGKRIAARHGEIFKARYLPKVRPFPESSDLLRDLDARDIFAAALAKLPSVVAAEVVVVGDTPYDVIAARQCDIATVALLSGGFDEQRLRAAGAAAVYADVAALRSVWSSSGPELPDRAAR